MALVAFATQILLGYGRVRVSLGCSSYAVAPTWRYPVIWVHPARPPPPITAAYPRAVALPRASSCSHCATCSWALPLCTPRYRLLGEKASFEKHGFDVQEAQLVAGMTPDSEHYGEDPEAEW
jgi:hypothetical protein